MTTYELETAVAKVEIEWQPDGLTLTVAGERMKIEEQDGYVKVEIGFELPEEVPGAD